MNASSPPPVEDLIIVAVLALGWAVLTIASAVLQLLVGPRPRPADTDPLELADGGGDEPEELEALPPATYPVIIRRLGKPAPVRLTSADALANVPPRTLRQMCERAGLETFGTARQLRARLAEHHVDVLNDPGPESLTPAQRNAGGPL